MPEPLQIEDAIEGDVTVVAVRGELDVATAGLLDGRLRALLAEEREIVLDLSELAFIDSSGLAVLISAAQIAGREGGAFSLSAVSPSVMRVLELSGVAGKLKLLPR